MKICRLKIIKYGKTVFVCIFIFSKFSFFFRVAGGNFFLFFKNIWK